ncbi:MAG: OprD family outer membrane porin [Sulfuricurvum sp.]
MKAKLALSLMTLLAFNTLDAKDAILTAFEGGKVSGEIRSFYINREYRGLDVHRDALAVGGWLRYETAPIYGVSAGAALYTTNKLNHKHKNDTSNDKTLLGKDGKSMSYLGEAYLKYVYEGMELKAGRGRFDSPMMGSDDARELPNLFEGVFLSSKDFADTTITLAHVGKFAAGTFSNAYVHTASALDNNPLVSNPAYLSITSGYSGVAGLMEHTGEFTNMGEYAFGRKNGGVSLAGVEYEGIANLKLTLWDYYAHNLFNTIYADALYSIKVADLGLYAGVQYIRQDGVGSEYAGKVGSDFVAGKVGAKYEGVDLYVATSYNSKKEGRVINGGTITPWGGMPAYTQGMVTRHQFFAGTASYKAALSYNTKTHHTLDLTTIAYYAWFDMDALNGYSTTPNRASEVGCDFIYKPQDLKNLQLRFRANFPRDYRETLGQNLGWNEYRFIANYTF